MRLRAFLGLVAGLLLAFTLGGASSAFLPPHMHQWTPGDQYLLYASGLITLALLALAFRRERA